MNFECKYNVSYGTEETFDDKIKRLENLPIRTFARDYLLDDNKSSKSFYHLYHGLRFNGLDKLESIVKCGFILCGRDVVKSFKSHDGSNKKIILNYNDIENCNNGNYISVMPLIPFDYNNIEFLTFIKENIFLELSSDVEALGTYYLKYDDYMKLKMQQIQTKNLYSYAMYEYFVKGRIPLDKILSIGINTDYYIGDVDKTIQQILQIKRHYNVDIPLNISGFKKFK